ncbi:MAG: phosphoglycerate mutase [Sulfurimonas sp. RIFOXYD12_FULL_36_11]|jgi:broad specificity phosphatase PhoE|uniref:histidine phosphatase family protein n=1 Tax=Sulfurimonas sp. RIFOXYB12_FULL_35_9 TaxID=1802256 RepID=UPI0008B6ED71|nr:histidine phosphatase family protein [Sulfurimonas sp. RIFOXYB12_FULL_35_9]MDX9757486.1 histidine phosphatase family protein [Sulfurimonas sp.]OHE03607.1 MAG: phosphoglycerate mutase [Sulfurimonas sp. RIFOXYB12_FULL_35_9]OHE16626.1 MAG: phosphoglycerate mutase [Sulfurimonas sp. RIFOXYD12_FULL_36_11]
MRVTLVRHAEVDERYQNCYNGHNEIGLSKKGYMQAKELVKKLDILEFDAVFCSDLPRAKETLKHSLHAKEAIYTDKLREKSWGKHEGLSFDEIISEGEIEYVDFLQWIESLDGEPYREYIKRVEKFFFEFLPSLNKESVLVVTHAGVIRVLMSIVKKITLEEAFCMKVENCSLTLFEI